MTDTAPSMRLADIMAAMKEPVVEVVRPPDDRLRFTNQTVLAEHTFYYRDPINNEVLRDITLHHGKHYVALDMQTMTVPDFIGIDTPTTVERPAWHSTLLDDHPTIVYMYHVIDTIAEVRSAVEDLVYERVLPGDVRVSENTFVLLS